MEFQPTLLILGTLIGFLALWLLKWSFTRRLDERVNELERQCLMLQAQLDGQRDCIVYLTDQIREKRKNDELELNADGEIVEKSLSR